MKILLSIIIALLIASCGSRTGTYPENDIIPIPKIETCLVETISLSDGNYQYFIIRVKNKKQKSYDIGTKVLNFNIGDSVIVVDETIIMKKK